MTPDPGGLAPDAAQPNTVTTVPVNLPVVSTVEVVDGEPIEIVDYLGISVLSLGRRPARAP